MTAAPSGARLNVFADLQIVADGQSASLVGDGRVLTFTARRRSSSGRPCSTCRYRSVSARSGVSVQSVGHRGCHSDDQGLELHIVGPDRRTGPPRQPEPDPGGRSDRYRQQPGGGRFGGCAPADDHRFCRGNPGLFWPVLAGLASAAASVGRRSSSASPPGTPVRSASSALGSGMTSWSGIVRGRLPDGCFTVMTTIGLIGSGNIGQAIAKQAIAHGYTVVLSNSRGPETLADLVAELGPQASAATAEQAAAAGDIAVVTVPFKNYLEVPVAPSGRQDRHRHEQLLLRA